MNISFGPVPHWSAPLSDKLIFVVLILGIVFVGQGIRSRSQAKPRDVIIFIVIALALVGLVAAFHWF